MNSYSGTVSEI